MANIPVRKKTDFIMIKRNRRESPPFPLRRSNLMRRYGWCDEK
ncbi:hypothetical protein B194_4884 [Serratia plymuthica A30]|nr:hypothetical protein B194_4884 [Serratia plymuthica A30]